MLMLVDNEAAPSWLIPERILLMFLIVFYDIMKYPL